MREGSCLSLSLQSWLRYCLYSELLTNCLNQKMKSSRRRRLVPAESKSQGFPAELLVESSRKKKRWRQMKKCRFQPIDCSRTITSGGSWIQQQRNQQVASPIQFVPLQHNSPIYDQLKIQLTNVYYLLWLKVRLIKSDSKDTQQPMWILFCWYG